MARLSIDDLNNLSGVSKENLDELYGCFRDAHTKMFNNINAWLNLYEKWVSRLETSEDNVFIYTKARSLYYKGSMVLDEVDLFDEFCNEYHSTLASIKGNNEVISNVATLRSVLRMKKKDVIERLSMLYGLYSEAYELLDEEEIYEG